MGTMRRITAITPTKRNPQRATVRVGAKVVATLSIKLIAELGLKVDQAWDEALGAQVAEAVVYDKAMREAIRRLNRRAMSRQQLDHKLRDLGHDQRVRVRVLDRLTDLNVLNDEAFGRALIRDTQLRKAAGPKLLRAKLTQCGLERMLVDRLVEQATGGHDLVSEAAALARRRMRSMRRLDSVGRKRRLWGLLARRGFDPDTIEQALQQLPAVNNVEPGNEQ